MTRKRENVYDELPETKFMPFSLLNVGGRCVSGCLSCSHTRPAASLSLSPCCSEIYCEVISGDRGDSRALAKTFGQMWRKMHHNSSLLSPVGPFVHPPPPGAVIVSAPPPPPFIFFVLGDLCYAHGPNTNSFTLLPCWRNRDNNFQ